MEVWRYNRAESVALGLGTEWEPGAPFVSLLLRGRYAFSDRRGQVWAAVRRESPTSRLEVAAFREMRDADPLAPALGLGNSLSALWLAHDDGDYVFTEGASIRLQRSWRRSVDLVVGLRLARETAPRRLAHASLNDLLGGTGRFAPAGPVLAGTFTTAEAEAAGGRTPFSWRVGFEGSAGEGRTRVRGWLRATGGTRLPLGLGLTTSGWVGLGAGDSVPQREFRVGGLRTLRG